MSFFNNPNDPNKPKPNFTFGQNQPLGGNANPSTPGQPSTTGQGAFGAATSTPAGNPSTGAFGQQTGNAFGQPQQSGFGTQSGGTLGGFGGTSTGQNTAANKPSMFGAGLTNPPSAFGTSGAPSAFGGTNSGSTTPVPQKTFGTFGANTTFGAASSTPASAPSTATTFGFGSKPAETTSTTPANKTGFGFGGATSNITPFGAPQQSQQQTENKPTENKFGMFGASTTQQTTGNTSGFGGAFGQPTQQQQQSQGQSTEIKPAFGGFGLTQQTTSTSKPAESNPTFGGFSQKTTQPTESRPAFGGFGQSSTSQQPTISITSETKPAFGGFSQQPTSTPDKPAEPKPAFGGFNAAAKTSPWGTAATTTDRPTENKAFGAGAFASAPASTSSTPKPPELNTTTTAGGFGSTTTTAAATTPLSGFGGFKLGQTDSTTSAQTKDQPTQPIQSTTTGGFGAKPLALGAGLGTSGTTGFSLGVTPGTSTAATSVSGDSTSTTPAPIKKDFAGFAGITPSGTPVPNEKEGEKKEEKKFGFGTATTATTEKDGEKPAFPSFGAFGQKKDDATADDAGKKEDEKTKTFGGFGAAAGTDKATTSEAKTDTATALQGMKNKTMEEIIHKWTGELDRCGEQFKTQANDIRRWDAILVENGDKIAKLYTATLEATQTQDRIDTALSYIEDSQSELSLLLDHYEDVVRECFEQLGGREAMQPADQERETMYSLAETVNSELDECVKGLGAMIDEINASAKGGGGGDLLGEVVKVLNEQLVSLGWIDEVSSKVEERVGKMEREARELSEGFTG